MGLLLTPERGDAWEGYSVISGFHLPVLSLRQCVGISDRKINVNDCLVLVTDPTNEGLRDFLLHCDSTPVIHTVSIPLHVLIENDRPSLPGLTCVKGYLKGRPVSVVTPRDLAKASAKRAVDKNIGTKFGGH